MTNRINTNKKINNIIIKLKNLFFKNNRKANLSQRAIHSGFWVLALKITGGLLNLTRLIIIARVLAPHDFGLMGVALLTIGILEVFSQTGFQSALIQKKKDIKSYLDSAWTISILRGFILFTILYFIAPYAAIFFKAPTATSIIRTVGFSILLQAFTNIAIIYFQKELEFNKQFFYQLSGILADFVVAVSLAIIFKNVWALVFGLLAGNFVRLVVSYFIHPYRPHFTIDLRKVKELFVFGKWILGSSILIFLITQGDDILVGKLLGATMLGFYQMAYRISNMPATQITHIISQVTFPIYSKLQNDLSKSRETYLKVLQLTMFFSAPIASLIFILAPEFTKIFLGEKWMPMVPAIQVLAIAGLIRSMAATTGPVFYAKGKPKIDTKWQMIRLFIIIILIYPFIIKWGIFGASIVILLSIFISNIGFFLDVMKISHCKIKNLSKTIAFPLINGFIMASTILILKTNIGNIEMYQLFILSAIGILTYLATTHLFDKYLNYKMLPRLKRNLDYFMSYRNKK